MPRSVFKFFKVWNLKSGTPFWRWRCPSFAPKIEYFLKMYKLSLRSMIFFKPLPREFLRESNPHHPHQVVRSGGLWPFVYQQRHLGVFVASVKKNHRAYDMIVAAVLVQKAEVCFCNSFYDLGSTPRTQLEVRDWHLSSLAAVVKIEFWADMPWSAPWPHPLWPSVLNDNDSSHSSTHIKGDMTSTFSLPVEGWMWTSDCVRFIDSWRW